LLPRVQYRMYRTVSLETRNKKGSEFNWHRLYIRTEPERDTTGTENSEAGTVLFTRITE
jgi:hypothetical protein